MTRTKNFDMTKNEAEYISRKYLNHDSKSPYLECSLLGLGKRKAKRILSNWHSFESPDIYTKYDKTVYGLEHFKYDARKRNKNGSQQRRDEMKIKQSADKKIRKKIKTENSITIHEEIKSVPKPEYYKDNFITSFKLHYSKIDQYKENLSSKLGVDKENVTIWFIAEDETILGSRFEPEHDDNINTRPFFPLFFPEIENLFIESKNLEGIIFISAENPYDKTLTLVKRTKHSVKELKKYHDYRGEPLFFFENPQVVMFAGKINIE